MIYIYFDYIYILIFNLKIKINYQSIILFKKLRNK